MKWNFSSPLEGMQQVSEVHTVLTSYPSNKREFASLPQLQNEVVMHPFSHPSSCIHVSFAGGEGTLGNIGERRADTSTLLHLERMSPRVLLNK